MLKHPVTLQKAFSHLCAIYSASDALNITGGRSERYAFLQLACGDISRCLRKREEKLYPIALAQAFAWYISLVEEIFRVEGGILLTNGMHMKYPLGRCAYCGHTPCRCDEAKRADATLNFDIGGSRLSLDEWQDNLAEIYGEINRKNGVERALNRLFEELSEVGRLVHLADGAGEDLMTIREKMSCELADVLAWLLGLSQLLILSLEEAVVTLYGNGCPVCKHLSCECKNFARKPGGGLTHRFLPAEEVYQCIAA